MNKMNIESAKYCTDMQGQNVNIRIIIDGTESFVPLKPYNRHYAEIMRQVDAGELTIQEPEKP